MWVGLVLPIKRPAEPNWGFPQEEATLPVGSSVPTSESFLLALLEGLPCTFHTGPFCLNIRPSGRSGQIWAQKLGAFPQEAELNPQVLYW